MKIEDIKAALKEAELLEHLTVIGVRSHSGIIIPLVDFVGEGWFIEVKTIKPAKFVTKEEPNE